MPKLGTKMVYLGIFDIEFQKNYCYIQYQYSQDCQFAKFCEIMKMFNYGTKNTLIGDF